MGLSEGFFERASELMARYPTKRSALLMLLHEAQDEVGYVSADVIREIADLVGLNSADVAGVATFYTMYKRRPGGRYLISLCTNVGCQLWGSDDTIEVLKELVGPEGETSPDGMLTWEQVECLATCHWAPAAQVNYHDARYLTPDRARLLCNRLQDGRNVEEALRELEGPTAPAEADKGVPRA